MTTVSVCCLVRRVTYTEALLPVFDYIFHIDGTIEVRLSASGYLQGGFWEPTQEGYGTAIRDTTSAFPTFIRQSIHS